MKSISDIALDYIARGWAPLVLRPRTKIPIDENFNGVPIDINYAKRFSESSNIGVRLGAVSGIVDIDLDCPEARDLALKFLPIDTPIFGRKSAKYSHFLFEYSEDFQTKKFTDPINGSVLLEIRSNKVQTMFPPSVHPSGERIEWTTDPTLKPQRIPIELVRMLAATSLLARYWPVEGGRQDAHLALIGGLALSGMDREIVSHIVSSICYATNDEEFGMRLNVIDRTFDRVKEKEGVTNWGKLAELLRDDGKRIVKTIRGWLGFANEGKPKIYTHDPIAESVDLCIEAIADRNVYQRSRILTRIVHEPNTTGGIVRPIGAPSISIMSADTLREEIESAVDFYKVSKDGDESIVKPPKDIVNTILNRSEWAFIRPLVGIANHPITRADGSIVATDGYDLHSGIYLSQVPKLGDLMDPLSALKMLIELVQDFPFESDVDLSAWIAATLTGIVRYSFDGPTPLIIVDGNTRGVGKTLLADLTSLILYDRVASRREMPSSPEEWGKSLLGIAISGDPMILLDNVKSKVDSAYFEAILTGTQIQQRILGRNEELRLPIRTQFWITSNNASISTDLIRRSIRIRLASPYENPESIPDSKFKIPDIRSHVRRNRSEYLTALVSLTQIPTKRPARSMGSFEDWSREIRGRLLQIGLPDPAMTQDELAFIADDESGSIANVLSVWFSMFEDSWITINKILEVTAQPEGTNLRIAIGDLCGLAQGERPTNRMLARRIREHRDRVVDGFVLRARKGKANSSGAVTEWSVEQTRKEG